MSTVPPLHTAKMVITAATTIHNAGNLRDTKRTLHLDSTDYLYK